jgi:hypothetical protein
MYGIGVGTWKRWIQNQIRPRLLSATPESTIDVENLCRSQDRAWNWFERGTSGRVQLDTVPQRNYARIEPHFIKAEGNSRLGRVIVATITSLALGFSMQDDEWIKKLTDGRRVEFTYQVLPEAGAFITAQLEHNEVVYSVVLSKARNPTNREEVESHFNGELSKK